MKFDIVRFLRDHKIYYRDDGPNCAKDGVVIKCPFCGENDPSEHMGWDLKTGMFHCWRGNKHSGRKPHSLVMKLIGCSYEEASRIVGGETNLDVFQEQISILSSGSKSKKDRKIQTLDFPKSFKKLRRSGLGKFYYDYLWKKRGFLREDVEDLARAYGLRYCTTGYWRGRIIFPIKMDRELVTWTGRTISSRNELRYLSLSEDPGDSGQPPALKNVKDTLWNYDQLKKGGRALVLMEGPLDCLKTDFYGRKYGVRSTCLFGTGVTEEQVSLIADLRKRFDNLFVVGDDGAWSNVLGVIDRLSMLRAKEARLPRGVEDPGDLAPVQVRKFAKILAA